MDEIVDVDVLTVFQQVPHKGLARITATLEVLGFPPVLGKWVPVGDRDFPRVEFHRKRSHYTLTMGVSRRPFTGHISWLSVQALDEDRQGTSILLLCYKEADRTWSRSWSIGMLPDLNIDRCIHEWFPDNRVTEVCIDADGLIDATIQHMVNIFHEG